ncbi:helix-turn-helix domain-containing protein [Corynebacterium glucuronolyticum]|uniref:Helix-turn-helix transcriptional regulator n=2 Tax=Corynebacterium glucuronolyticum TaxID=39791 RepID=A0A7T4EFC1_9CORY|nr:helix-turn-helix transcriptional regulator [Corynebacterium glucuronolyticum]QQU87911.1 helix-turn-helix transcriptional regulator [Corynebacterium glucuronolyticum]QRO81622.1 helix-turn-helix transcriptional regulator [Corynebacterium glucuronolyticum]
MHHECVDVNSDLFYWPSYGLELGKRLRILRNMRGLTQERLGELSGYTRNQVSNLERNQNRAQHPSNPSMKMIYSLALALHVPPAVLLPRANQQVQQRCEQDDYPSLSVNLTWPQTAQDVARFSVSHLTSGAPGAGTADDPSYDVQLIRPKGLSDEEWRTLSDAVDTLSAAEKKLLDVLRGLDD